MSAKHKQYVLTLKDNLKDLLRTLYSFGIEYFALEWREELCIFNKDDLISLIERGLGDTSVEKVTLSLCDEWYLYRNKSIEDEDVPVLLIGKNDSHVETAKEFKRDNVAAGHLPDWWGVPLPLLTVFSDSCFLNKKGREIVERRNLTDEMLAKIHKKDKVLIALPGTRDNPARRVLFSYLGENCYLLDDVSDEVFMAKDISWWASVGKACVERMRSFGYRVSRHDVSDCLEKPLEEKTEEMLPCMWKGDLLGYLEIERQEEREEDL